MAADRLTQLLGRWQEWELPLTAPPKCISKPKSFSDINDTYVIGSERWRAVIKIRQVVSQTFERSWDNELSATKMASDLGIGPTLIFQDFEDDYLILEYVDARPLETCPNLTDSLATILASLHRQKLSLTTRNYKEEARRYLGQINKLDSNFAVQNQQLFEGAIRSADRLSDPTEHVVCHHDISAENILSDGKNLYFIDWEYACLAHPLFDLVCSQQLVRSDHLTRTNLTDAYQKKMGSKVDLTLLAHSQRLFHFYAIAWNLYLLHEQQKAECQTEIHFHLEKLQSLAH